jgi:hypothetical protein
MKYVLRWLGIITLALLLFFVIFILIPVYLSMI